MIKISWNDHVCDEKRRKSHQNPVNIGSINSYQISESICSFFTHPEFSNEREQLARKENLLQLAGDQDLPSHNLKANEPGRAWHHLRELLHSCIRSGRFGYAQHSHGHRLNEGCCSLQTRRKLVGGHELLNYPENTIPSGFFLALGILGLKLTFQFPKLKITSK